MTIFVHIFIKGVIRKNYHSDIEHYMTLNLIFNVGGGGIGGGFQQYPTTE